MLKRHSVTLRAKPSLSSRRDGVWFGNIWGSRKYAIALESQGLASENHWKMTSLRQCSELSESYQWLGWWPGISSSGPSVSGDGWGERVREQQHVTYRVTALDRSACSLLSEGTPHSPHPTAPNSGDMKFKTLNSKVIRYSQQHVGRHHQWVTISTHKKVSFQELNLLWTSKNKIIKTKSVFICGTWIIYLFRGGWGFFFNSAKENWTTKPYILESQVWKLPYKIWLANQFVCLSLSSHGKELDECPFKFTFCSTFLYILLDPIVKCHIQN